MRIDYLAKPVGFTIFQGHDDQFLQAHLVGPERRKLENLTVRQGVQFALDHADMKTAQDRHLKDSIESLLESESCYFVIFDKTVKRVVGDGGRVLQDMRDAPFNSTDYFLEDRDATGIQYWLCNVRVCEEGSEYLG